MKCANDRCDEEVKGEGFYNEHYPEEKFCSQECLDDWYDDPDFDEESVENNVF